MNQKKSLRVLLPLLFLAAAAALLFGFLSALSNLRSDQGEEARQQLEDAIRRAAVSCYASEGVYPPNVAYLQTNYGIQINEDRYTVYYDRIASNLMPDITVLDNES